MVRLISNMANVQVRALPREKGLEVSLGLGYREDSYERRAKGQRSFEAKEK